MRTRPGDSRIHQFTTVSLAAKTRIDPGRREIGPARHMRAQVAASRAARFGTIQHHITDTTIAPLFDLPANLRRERVPMRVRESGFFLECLSTAERIRRIPERAETHVLH